MAMGQAMEQARGILLRRYRFSENSLVVVWFTDLHGKVKTAVRGATKPGGSFSGRLELFSESEIAFKVSTGELHALREVVPVTATPMPGDYDTLLAAAYFCELCDLCTEPMHPVPELHGLLVRAWGFLRKERPTRRAVEHFEQEMARILGILEPSVPARHSLAGLMRKLPESRQRLLERLSESP